MFKWFVKKVREELYRQAIAEGPQTVPHDGTLGWPPQEWNVGVRLMRLEVGWLVALDEIPSNAPHHSLFGGGGSSTKSVRRQFYLPDGESLGEAIQAALVAMQLEK
jgi:hypothetical protein